MAVSSIERRASPFTIIQGFLHGFSAGGGSNGLILDAMVVPVPAQMRLVLAVCQAGGVSPTVLDVLLNGTSVWHNPADRPTLASGVSGKFKSGRINRSALREGDVLQLIVVSAGGGSQLAATVALEDPSLRGG